MNPKRKGKPMRHLPVLAFLALAGCVAQVPGCVYEPRGTLTEEQKATHALVEYERETEMQAFFEKIIKELKKDREQTIRQYRENTI